MQGWKIFIHSVRMVFENLGPALRISGLLYVTYVAVNLYFMLNYSDDLLVLQLAWALGIIPPEPPRGFYTAMVLSLVTALLVNLWVAVLWHRFVLLSQISETVVPPFYPNVIVTYFGKTVQLMLMLIPVGVVVLVVLSLAFGSFAGKFTGMIIPQILLGVFLYLFYRFGLIFPAVALKTPMNFKTSWEKTKAGSGAIGQLAVIVIAASIVIRIPGGMNPDPISVINLTYSYVVGWIAMMVGVSIFTTLYGVYIEGREL